MTSPGARLVELLEAENVGKSELATRIRELGLGKCRYQEVHRWCQGRGFDDGNQMRAAMALGVAVETFSAPPAALARLNRNRAHLARFLATRPIAKVLTAGDLDVLRSLRFDGQRKPSVAYFEAVAYALLGLIPADEVSAVAEVNAALDHTLATKPPLKRR